MNTEKVTYINKIIRHYIRVHNGKEFGPDLVQDVWVKLLEKSPSFLGEEEIDLLNEESRIQLWSTIRGIVRNDLKLTRISNKRNVHHDLESGVNQADNCIDFVARESLLIDLHTILYPELGQKLSVTEKLIELFLDGTQDNTIQDWLNQSGLSALNLEQIKEAIQHYLLSAQSPESVLSASTYNNSNLKCPNLEKSQKISKINSMNDDKSNDTNDLQPEKKFHIGHQKICQIHFPYIRPDVIAVVIEKLNEGYKDSDILVYLAFDSKGRRYKKPKLSMTHIKAIKHLCQDVSTEYAAASVPPDDARNTPPDQPDSTRIARPINNLRDCEEELNRLGIKARVVIGNHAYISIYDPCPICNAKYRVQVFEDRDSGELVYCCMKCRDRGKDELHRIYKSNRGRDINGLLRMFKCEVIEDYCFV